MIYFTCIIIAVVLGYSVVLAVLARTQARERKDLYDRIMAGSLSDFKAASETPRARDTLSAHKRAIEEWKSPKE